MLKWPALLSLFAMTVIRV